MARLLLPTIILLIYCCSPPRNLTIEINANPQGDQRFYVITRSSRNSLHGIDVKHVDKRLVLAEKIVKIPIDQEKALWFGRLSVTVYHPEYFYENESADNNFILPKVSVTPTSWSKALAKSPSWELEVPPYEERTEQYLADHITHKIINFSHAQHHLSSFNNQFIEEYLNDAASPQQLKKSIAVFDVIIEAYDKAMQEQNIILHKHVKFFRKQINETHKALDKLHQKTQNL